VDAAVDPDEGEPPDDASVRALMTRAALLRPTGAQIPPQSTIVPPEDADDAVDRSMPGTNATTGFRPISLSLAYRLVTALGWTSQNDGAVVNAHDHDRGDIRQDRDEFLAWMQATADRIVTDFSRASLDVLLPHVEGVDFSFAELRTMGLNAARMRDATGKQLRPVILFSVDEACMRVGDVREAGLHHPSHERQGDAIPAKAPTGGTVMMFAIISPVGYEAGTAISIGEHDGGWWTNARLLAYFEDAIPALKHRWAGCELVFLFDNAPSHRMMGPVNLDPTDLNLRDGAVRLGKTLVKGATWAQVDALGRRVGTSPRLPLMTPEGKAVGLRRLVRTVVRLAKAHGEGSDADDESDEGEGEGEGDDDNDDDEDDEGGADDEEEDRHGVVKWPKEVCVEYLRQERPDLRRAPSLLQELCARLGTTALYTPKLHCELQWVERFWAWIKRWARRRAREFAGDTPLDQLAKTLAEAMRSIGTEAPAYIYHSFINAARYAQMYALKMSASEAFAAVRLVVGHGRILAVTRSHRYNGILLDDATGGVDAVGDGDGEEEVAANVAAGSAAASPTTLWEGAAEPAAMLSSEDVIGLMAANDTSPERLFSGHIGRSRPHNPTCQGCGRGAAARRALHACNYCYNVYHTGCIQPWRTKMPLPGDDFACPVCCLLMERHIKDEFDNGAMVVAETALDAIGVPHVRPILQPRAVYDLFTKWTHWTPERRDSRWLRIADRFAALLESWPMPVSVAVDATLRGVVRGHPIVSVHATGERVVYAA
jgi:hypothetical protein